MTYEYDLISEKKLPEGFKYPKSFLHYLKYNETEEETSIEECWEERNLIRTIDDGEEYLSFFYRRLQHDFPNKNFVPFARLYDDLIYCFDGNDTSGDPGIYIVKTFTNQWGIDNQSFEEVDYENFYEWLRMSLWDGANECGCWRAIVPYSKIPQGFTFPQEYLNLIKISDIDSFATKSIYFVSLASCDDSREKFYELYDKIKIDYRDIIPFAYEGKADIVAFDSNEKNGNPRVYLIDTDTSMIKKEYNNFQEWWETLEQNHMFYKKNHEK